MYECVSQGRQWWYSLHMTTDARFTLRDMQPDFGNRRAPYPDWWQYGAGSPYPMAPQGAIYNDLEPGAKNAFGSVVILRDTADPRNLSGGKETYVPARLLRVRGGV